MKPAFFIVLAVFVFSSLNSLPAHAGFSGSIKNSDETKTIFLNCATPACEQFMFMYQKGGLNAVPMFTFSTDLEHSLDMRFMAQDFEAIALDLLGDVKNRTLKNVKKALAQFVSQTTTPITIENEADYNLIEVLLRAVVETRFMSNGVTQQQHELTLKTLDSMKEKVLGNLYKEEMYDLDHTKRASVGANTDLNGIVSPSLGFKITSSERPITVYYDLDSVHYDLDLSSDGISNFKLKTSVGGYIDRGSYRVDALFKVDVNQNQQRLGLGIMVGQTKGTQYWEIYLLPLAYGVLPNQKNSLSTTINLSNQTAEVQDNQVLSNNSLGQYHGSVGANFLFKNKNRIYTFIDAELGVIYRKEGSTQQSDAGSFINGESYTSTYHYTRASTVGINDQYSKISGYYLNANAGIEARFKKGFALRAGYFLNKIDADLAVSKVYSQTDTAVELPSTVMNGSGHYDRQPILSRVVQLNQHLLNEQQGFKITLIKRF